ncbi:MAG: 2Fe-2S iron-sulfur cluster binding domain-containing protein [Gammaproteobacteria bacterium]|nr:2Fe-2S iron-sulfur cluster binding domain-containing protein [Gammaproteobacteria bacterium]
MSYRITLAGSGHQFQVEGNETLLEAGLRSGIHLRYGCNNGNCGDCRAKLLEGEVSNAFHDFPFTEAEKMQHSLLLCRSYPRSDLVIEANEILAAHEIVQRKIKTRVAKRELINPTTLLLQLRTPRTRLLEFFPGQHIEVTLANGLKADLPIASCPCNGMMLQLHTCREGNDFNDYLFTELKQGDSVTIFGPFGDFMLDGESRRPILFITEGIHFAPVKSLIEQCINLDLPQSLQLWWLAESPQGHYLDNHCRSWEVALDNFHYHPIAFTAAPQPPLLDQLFRQIFQQLQHHTGYDIYLSASSETANLFQQLHLKLRGDASGDLVLRHHKRTITRS